MRIATWNVNSIRTRLNQVQKWLLEMQPDVLCLQETKVDDPLFPKNDLEENGYNVFYHGQKAYNGVALLSRHPLTDIKRGFVDVLENDNDALTLSEQKRVISCVIEGVRIVNLYVPNGSDLKSDKYQYKLKWLNCLSRYLKVLKEQREPICVVGDFNIALEGRDIHNPDRLTGGIMASDAERKALIGALGEDLVDIFRVFEQGSGHWSWWDYRSGAWSRDRGWRIDHIYLSSDLLKQTKSSFIDKKTRGNTQPSDHAPVLVDIEWPPSSELEDLEF